MGGSQFVKKIDSLSIKPYGKVIEYPGYEEKGTNRNLWKIVHKSDSREGWRIAYLVLRDKSITRLQCHPNTDETFEPLKGKALLFLSTEKDFHSVEAFWLDKPIVIHKGIWHAIIAPRQEVHLKICENNRVICKNFSLGFRMSLDSYLDKKSR